MSEKSFLSIDKDRLDREWLRQPELFYSHARELADARLEHEAARNALDLTRAEVDKSIRQRPQKYGFEVGAKPTETAIKGVIERTASFQGANRRVLDARHALDLHQAAVSALEQRKSALENLVKLHGQNYFAGPTVTDSDSLRKLAEQTAKKKSRRALDDDDDEDGED